MSALSELFMKSQQMASRSINICLPGRILSYDAGSQKASIQPVLGRKLRDGREEKLPVLSDVPVVWPRSGGAHITLPVSAGDGCLVIFCDRSLDEFKSEGGEVFPDDPRAHDLSDAVAIMGFGPFSSLGGSSSAIEIKMGGTTFTLDDGNVSIDAPAVTIKAPSTSIEGNVAVKGNFTVEGGGGGEVNITSDTLKHNGINIGNTHKHSGVQTGGGDTGTPH